MKALPEVVVLPVSDPDRSPRFYRDRLGFRPGVDPECADYTSFVDFRDPDGNAWALQERNHQQG